MMAKLILPHVSNITVNDGLSYRILITHLAHWIEYVWTLIHFLLGGFVIYQWFEPAHEAAIHGVGWHFVVSVLLSSAWLTLLVSFALFYQCK